MTHSQQRGSLLKYVLVGVLLVALLVGGVLLVRNNIARLGGPATSPVAVNNDQKQKPTTNSGQQSSSDADNRRTADEKKAAEEKAKAEIAAKQAEAEKKAKEQNEATKRQQQSGTTAPQTLPQPASQTPHTATAPTAEAAPSDKLPHTGPLDGMLAALTGGTLLVGASIAYARSRSAL